VRELTDRQRHRDRCSYWADWHAAPDGAMATVSYDIAGEGHGFYQRPLGPPRILYRWDSERRIGSSLTRGGGWYEDDRPERTMYLGSDYGQPVSVRTAREIAEQLGAPDALADYEVHPVRPRRPAAAGRDPGGTAGDAGDGLLCFVCAADGTVTVARSLGAVGSAAFGSGFFARRRAHRTAAPAPAPDRVFTVDGRVVAVTWPDGARGPLARVTDDRDDAALDAALARQAAAHGLPPPTDREAFAAELERRRPRVSAVRLLLTEPFRRRRFRR
jgi:hypothetical protein